MHYTFRNVNEGLPVMVDIMRSHGRKTTSRNGPVLYIDEPVMITYTRPLERVLLMKERKCNPFLHLADAMHLLAGRNDVEYLARFSKQITNYSDDGAIFHGAYGRRLATQLETAIGRLGRYKDDRRTVLSIYDPKTDQMSGNECKDIPCNTQIYLSNTDNKISMTVTQRSGDLMWGTMGANVVQFSYLLEYIADRLHKRVGTITHMCNNLHVYTEFGPWMHMQPYMFRNDVYPFDHTPLRAYGRDFIADLNMWIDKGLTSRNDFIRTVVQPMEEAHSLYKSGLRDEAALLVRQNVTDDAWREYTSWWLS